MLGELDSYLGFETEDIICTPRNILLQKTGTSANPSFLLHYFLSTFLKNGKKVLLISFANTLSHYQSIQSKLKCSLKDYKDQFSFIDGFQVIETIFTNSLPGQGIFSGQHSQGSMCAEKETICGHLKSKIIDILEAKKKNSSCDNQLLLIDSINPMVMTETESTKSFIEFLHFLREYKETNKLTTFLTLNFPSSINHSSHEEPKSRTHYKLIQYMKYLVDMIFQVDDLQTFGISQDIHGLLTIINLFPSSFDQQSSTTSKKNNPQRIRYYRFKTFDNTVKIYKVSADTIKTQ